MRLKRTFCMGLALAMIIACFSVNAMAMESDEYVGTYEVYASGNFSMDVPAKTTVKANSSFPLEAGEIVTIKASYSPFSASVDFGVIAPDGLFYGLNTTTGSFDKGIKVNQRGHYYFAIRNNSSDAIHVSGHVNY